MFPQARFDFDMPHVPEFTDSAGTLDKTQLGHATEIVQLLKAGQNCLLSGSAGTGKTYTAVQIITFLRDHGLTVAVTAPTHRAAQVLNDELPDDMRAVTIHSFLGLKPRRTPEGKTVLQGTMREKPHSHLLVLDEASMVGKAIQYHVDLYCRDHGVPVLYLGDVYQLAPVEEESNGVSPIFLDQYIRKFPLYQAHRQKEGSDIIELATAIRDAMINELSLPKLTDFIGKQVKHYPVINDWAKRVVGGICDKENFEDRKIIAGTNDTVLDYNYRMRRRKYGYEDRMPRVGEYMVANAAIVDPFERDEILLPNNAVVRVLGVEEKSIGAIKGWLTYCYCAEVEESEVEIFIAEKFEDLQMHLNPLKLKARQEQLKGNKSAWADFFKIKNQVADMRPNFASTVHKAQGSGFHSVYLDLNDMAKLHYVDAPNYRRAVYTAVTRAKKKLHVIGGLK